MCGLVGVAGEIGHKEKMAFRNLLHFDTFRGPHSTGVVSVDMKNNATWEKCLGTPFELFEESKNFDKKGLWLTATKCLIGHNRWATMGKITPENAHPFQHDNIIGVHNGTLDRTSFNNIINGDKNKQFEVDSDGLFYHIKKKGLKKTINSINGAWSIVYYDRENRHINFLRNNDRPMYYCYKKEMAKEDDKRPQTVFWASEPWMIKQACELAKVEIHTIHSTMVDKHYFADLSGKSFVKKGLKFLYKKESVEEKPLPPTNHYWGRNTGGAYHSGIHNKVKDRKDFPLYKKVEDLCVDGKLGIYFLSEDNFDNQRIAWASVEDPTITGHLWLKYALGKQNEDTKKALQRSVGWYEAKITTYVLNDELALSVNSTDCSEMMEWGTYPWPKDSDRQHDLPCTLKEVKSYKNNVVKLEDQKKSQYNKQYKGPSSGVGGDHDTETVAGPEQKRISKENFRLLVSMGCSYCCNKDVEPERADEIMWLSNLGYGSFVCPDCDGQDYMHDFASDWIN